MGQGLLNRWGSIVLCMLLGPLACADDALLERLDPGADSEESLPLRGMVRARQRAVLASDLAARIESMPFAAGQAFDKGAELVRFDCAAYQAQSKAARARVRLAQEELNHNRRLAALNSVGKYEVSVSQARLAEAEAESGIHRIQVQRCTIRAPYAGRVVERRAQPHENVTAGTPVLEIVDNSRLEIVVLVPSRWVGHLQPGQVFTFMPDETGQPFQATLETLGARVDEGSQTLQVMAPVPEGVQGLLDGMSGSARFGQP